MRVLHQLPVPPVELPKWRPLQSLHTLTAGTIGTAALSHHDQRWLLTRIEDVQRDLAALDWPLGYTAIHGDAWAGNLLWDTANAGEPVPG